MLKYLLYYLNCWGQPRSTIKQEQLELPQDALTVNVIIVGDQDLSDPWENELVDAFIGLDI